MNAIHFEPEKDLSFLTQELRNIKLHKNTESSSTIPRFYTKKEQPQMKNQIVCFLDFNNELDQYVAMSGDFNLSDHFAQI